MAPIKFGIFSIFLKLYSTIILPFQTFELKNILGSVLIASFIFSIIAIGETVFSRILAITSVNQIGYVALGFLGGGPDTLNSTLFYMLVYVFSIIGIFMCLNQTTSLPQDK
jgi:NADH:ubiquinone oxidoreductase subunit 2 (subunit N)